MYKITPSLLDEFRIIKNEIFEKSIDEFKKKVKGEFVYPTKAQNIGTLIHSYLESGVTELDGISLTDSETAQLDIINQTTGLFDWFSEMKFRYNLTENIIISMKIDKLKGSEGAELKTGSRNYGVDFYDKSIQWKLYCEGLELKKFIYYHIQYNQKRPFTFKLSQFDFYYNKSMKNDLINESEHFIDWCVSNNLEKFIKL